ncbi:hypothetical protein LOK49_LG10G00916 [Camellia lanceoleosa]|uniref:Uncharacterized protein n=1 Tax=Camellia lanceoleosa TaxID=1840588 RepID=A0ACC0GF81_9ERIC|nr:hypothetical protein LOK49_LG10G00916 [Camellia lanceoleosa]
MLSCWVEDPNGDYFKKHLARIPDYIWVAEDGIKMQVKDNPSGDFKKMFGTFLKDLGLSLIKIMVVLFLLQCCLLLLSQLPPEIVGEKHEAERLYDAVDVMLSLQILNPTVTFADIVIEHESVECTTSSIQAFVLFMKLYPGHCKMEIEVFHQKAVRFLEDIQLPDGSWYRIGGLLHVRDMVLRWEGW